VSAQSVRQPSGPSRDRSHGPRAARSGSVAPVAPAPRTIAPGTIAPVLEPELSNASMRVLEVGLALGAIATAVLIGLLR
jgi:hypothetical protein